MSLKDRALRTAVLKAVSDALKAEVEADRSELFDALCDLHDATGAKSLDVTLPDGRKVASISLAMPTAGCHVSDEAAYFGWIKANFPAAIVRREVVEISDAFTKTFLARCQPAGNPLGSEIVDTETGFLVEGVEYREAGAPKSFSVRFEKTGREQIAAAWSDGDFGTTLPGIAPDRPALPPVVE